MMKCFVLVLGCVNGLRPRASTLEEWLDGLKLKFEVDYDDKFSGIKVEVDKMDCESIEIDVINAEYLAPRGFYLDIDDINAKCEGKYDWSYNTGLGKVKGDGKVEAIVKNSRVETEMYIQVDDLQAPNYLHVDRCDADIKITDIDTRGDPLGDAANAFIDSFAPFFEDEIEKYVCDLLRDYGFDLVPTLQKLDIDPCVASLANKEKVVNTTTSFMYDEDVVDWDALIQNGTGPGARLVGGLYKATNKPRPAQVIEYGLDLAADFNLPLATPNKHFELKSDIEIIEQVFNKPNALLQNLSFIISNASLSASIPLSQISVEAYLNGETQSKPERVAFGFALPSSVAFNASADAQLTLAIGEVGEWFSQDLLSPILDLRAGLAFDVWDLSLDAVFALGLVPRLTREGLNNLFLGDVAAPVCLRSAFNLVEAALPQAHFGYRRSRLLVSNTRFVPANTQITLADDSLEKQIARSVIPALIDLVELGFPEFTECAIDQLIQTDGTESISDSIREYIGVLGTKSEMTYTSRCETQRPDWNAQYLHKENNASLNERLVDLSTNSLAKLITETVADLSIDTALITIAEQVAKNNVVDKYNLEQEYDQARDRFISTATSKKYLDHIIIIAKNAADKIRIGPLSTTLRLRDVFVANLDQAIGNVTLMPGGKDALVNATRIELLDAANSKSSIPLIAGFTLEVTSPIGNALISVNASFYNIRIDNFALDLFLDSPTVNVLNVGSDLGLASLFTHGATLSPLVSCLASTLQAVSIPQLPKVHVGNVILEAWSEVEGLDDVVKNILETAVGFVNKYVSAQAAREEITWLLNDALDNQLSIAKDTCQTAELSSTYKIKETPVAPRRDARGEKPSAVAREDSQGVSGDLALTADAFAVALIIAVMFATFAFIWFQKKGKASAGRALSKYVTNAKSLVMDSFRSKSKKGNFLPTTDAQIIQDDYARESAAAQDFAQAYVGKYDESEFLKKGEERLMFEAPLPAILRYGILLIMLANIGVLISSNIALAAQARIKLFFKLADRGDDTIWLGTNSKFSLIDSVTELWESGSYLLALLVAGLSGFWPYLEIGLLIWGYTGKNINPKRREWIWRCVEMFSKWSFIDVFIVVFLVVAFYIHVDLKLAENDSQFRAELFIEPRYAFYAFCLATLTSMCLGQIVLNLHRQVHHLGRGRFHALEKLSTESQGGKIVSTPHDLVSKTSNQHRRHSLASHPLNGKSPRFWQFLIAPCIICVGGLLIAAMLVDVVVFEIGGAAGFIIDITDGSEQSKKLSAPGIAYELSQSLPNDGWRPLVQALEWIVLIFACIIPLLHVLLLGILWLIPLTAPSQVRLLAFADVAYGWSSLDVYLVTILATATQVNKLSESLAKDQCRSINGYIAAFFDQAIDGDLTCFQVAVKVKTGCILLAAACCAQMTLGYLTASVTSTAVAERVVQAALGRPDDASILCAEQPSNPAQIELVSSSVDGNQYTLAATHSNKTVEQNNPLPPLLNNEMDIQNTSGSSYDYEEEEKWLQESKIDDCYTADL
mmetsp:Transcript_23391/g.30357  ORF Transcript_23391/g.30357 Transcript_23391/m.30357 type:complete len:1526 (-) Transcript_23391:72-4649(-)